MPKRKKSHSARAVQRAEAKAFARELANKPVKKSQPKPKPKQEETHRPSPTPFPSSPPTVPALGTRFASLLTELRAEIFAWLLVRPVKWSATHIPTCPLFSPQQTSSPFQDIRPRLSPSAATCAEYSNNATSWRHRTLPVWQDPWRSTWAPQIRNEFVCSPCWDQRHRANGPAPLIDNLPCLCARNRRTRELAVLLVCKTWYEEGARVLYTRNTFAFSSPAECAAFFGALDPRWSAVISKVSLLAVPPVGKYPKSVAEELNTETFNARELRSALRLLSELPSLGKLELDALFLTRPACVRVLRWASLGHLRSLKFTQSPLFSPEEAPREYVWPRQVLRAEIERTEFTVDVGKGIKRCRYGWVRGSNSRGDLQAVSKERARYLARFTCNNVDIVRDENSRRSG
ncbi:hypothetical protein GGR50DRAFT_693252 [Xylaria sp. CBS 124048]|nr:hypothetical protein GGR50DRAFT_693252 [Xylaria sp. CBS 124048]